VLESKNDDKEIEDYPYSDVMFAPALCNRSLFLLFSQTIYQCDETVNLITCWGDLADGGKLAG
jgi:hypothetical protein